MKLFDAGYEEKVSFLHICKLPEPAVLHPIVCVGTTDGIPNTVSIDNKEIV